MREKETPAIKILALEVQFESYTLLRYEDLHQFQCTYDELDDLEPNVLPNIAMPLN